MKTGLRKYHFWKPILKKHYFENNSKSGLKFQIQPTTSHNLVLQAIFQSHHIVLNIQKPYCLLLLTLTHSLIPLETSDSPPSPEIWVGFRWRKWARERTFRFPGRRKRSSSFGSRSTPSRPSWTAPAVSPSTSSTTGPLSRRVSPTTATYLPAPSRTSLPVTSPWWVSTSPVDLAGIATACPSRMRLIRPWGLREEMMFSKWASISIMKLVGVLSLGVLCILFHFLFRISGWLTILFVILKWLFSCYIFQLRNLAFVCCSSGWLVSELFPFEVICYQRVSFLVSCSSMKVEVYVMLW